MTTNEANDILKDYDIFIAHAAQAVLENQSLTQLNKELRAEIDLLQQNLAHANNQIAVLNNEILEKYKDLSVQIKRTTSEVETQGREWRFQEQQVHTAYEIEVLSTCKKMLERDLQLQKNENERLHRLNHQLLREKQLNQIGESEQFQPRNHPKDLQKGSHNLGRPLGRKM